MANVKSNILDEINALIANTIIGSDRPLREPERTDITVATANDYIRKLDVLRRRLVAEIEPISVQMEMIKSEVRRMIHVDEGTPLTDLFYLAADPRIAEIAQRYRELEEQLTPKIVTAEFVTRLFYAECEREYPMLQGKRIQIDCNWELSYPDPKAVNPAAVIEGLLRTLMGGSGRSRSPL